MTNGSWVALSTLVGLMATSAARADLITIDADAYAPGTDVSNVFDGVTLSHVTFTAAGVQSSAVYAAGCSGSRCSALGAASFGWQNASGNINPTWYSTARYINTCLSQIRSYCYAEGQHVLEVSLDTATDFIQFDSTHLSDWPDVWAFDAAGNLLSLTAQRTVHQPFASPYDFGHQTVTLTSALSDISRIFISGNGGWNTIDSISFNAPVGSVPEPETLAMMMAGLLGIAVTTRRRRTAVAKRASRPRREGGAEIELR